MSATNTAYANIGENTQEGIDVALSWNSQFTDMGLESVPGGLSLNITTNFLLEQSLPVTVGGAQQDYAGYVGGSKFRSFTTLGYNWNDMWAQLTWQYRQGTKALGADNRPSDLFAGYPSDSLFTLNLGARFWDDKIEASLAVSNLLNTEPDPAGYPLADQAQGFGSFDPYADLVGRRYSLSLTMKF